jgi:threonine dehydrogenase-like Zn-dependent dehydrogenase
MRAAVWHGKRDVRVEKVPDPSVVNPRDAIVRVTMSAICGSDLHLWNGFVPGMQPGDVIGHEFMGEVVDIGSQVESLQIGDRVVVLCAIACGRCWYCTHDQWALCDNSNPAGSAQLLDAAYGHAGGALFGYSHLYGGYWGGQSEFVRVPFADVGCIKLDDDAISDDDALFLGDILPTGWMAAEHCNIQPGDVIAVFGCGPVGLFAIRSAFLQGAERVIAIDRVPERLELAKQHGQAEVIDQRDGDVLAKLDEMTGGRGPDACIDAVGMESVDDGPEGVYDRVKQALRLETDRPSALRLAIMACRKGGTVSIPGVFGGISDKIPLGAAFGKGLTFRMGQTHFHRYAKPLLDRIKARTIDPGFVISHRIGLDEVPGAYHMFNDKQDGCVKVVIRP